MQTTAVEVNGSSSISVAAQMNLLAEEVGCMEERVCEVRVVRESV